MKLFRMLFHRHTWRPLRKVYTYMDGFMKITVKKCQCRECGKIEYFHFNGKDIVY